MFNPACLYCGARMIQHLGTLPITPGECKARRLAVLRDWAQFGHCETTIRALVPGPLCIGPAIAAESASQTSEKTRCRGRR
jgi:hypothetical protein